MQTEPVVAEQSQQPQQIQQKSTLSSTWKSFRKLHVGIQVSIVALILMLIIAASATSYLTLAATATVTLSPIADAYVNRTDANKNYGNDKNLKSDYDRISYVKFNLASLANQQISKATFRFYITDDSSATHYFRNVLSNDWLENTITYNTKPQQDPTAFASIIGKPTASWKEIDVTEQVRLRAGQVWSFSVDTPLKNSENMSFNSRENNKNALQLVVQFASPAQPTVTPAMPTATPSPLPPTEVPSASPSGVTQLPTPTQSATSSAYPSQVLNLTNWKETLPIGSAGSPTEIKQPALATYKIDPWFIVAPSGNAVQFRAPVNGVTTSGSSYPRSELREMTNNGTSNASWTSSTGTHTMFIDEAITAVPATKKHVVAGQIHDASDDVIVIRLEYPKLFIDINGNDGPTLDPNYTLGKRFTVKFVASNNQTSIYYNGSTTPAYTLPKTYSGAYFKAGAYTQSNCSTEAANLCTSNNYGEVNIYQLQVTHQ